MKTTFPGCLLMLLLSIFFLQPAPARGDIPQAGIEDRTGSTVPLDLSFFDEQGQKETLGAIVNKPVILSFAYYTCPNFCNEFLGNVADALDRTDSVAGKDYTAVTVSFDGNDTPQAALKKKNNYISSFTKPFPAEGWRFLTGHSEDIKALASAVGFSFNREEKDSAFRHPVALIVLSPKGRIIRYLLGDRFIPADIDMAIYEAREERIGATIPTALSFCYTYDPKRHAYVFSFLKASGFLIMSGAAVFFIYLAASKRNKDKEAD